MRRTLGAQWSNYLSGINVHDEEISFVRMELVSFRVNNRDNVIMKNIIHEYSLTIVEHHLDFLGHVNNATYLQIFEEARWDLLRQMGFSKKELATYQISPIVLEVHVRFRRELLLGKHIKIRTEFKNIDKRIHEIYQTIHDGSENFCDAKFIVGIFDLRERKLISPPSIWKEALATML